MRTLAPLLALALLPFLPGADAASCRDVDEPLGPLGSVHAEGGTTCLGAEATVCLPDRTGAWVCSRVDAADLWPCLFCPGPVLW